MCKKITLFLILLFSVFQNNYAQRVGLVLSGGGAKGLTHIGVIRALEENNIPIDYITGTSMGAIIGSLYAMGYTPDEMVALLKSDDFKRWYLGDIEDKYIYYFKKNQPTPHFFNINFNFKDSLRIRPHILPTSVVNPIQMNLVFVDLFAQATAACQENFNNLFVPFRCIASDVYNKKELVMKSGDLGDAVRASMSFPLMFKPIKINDVLAYDGGIYNNFPIDVMQKDFLPNLIIGSTVSHNPGKPTEGDLMGQLENMIMQKTNYDIPDSVGVLLSFKYDDVNLMDFQYINKLHDIGYNKTISMIDSIKGRIKRRVKKEDIDLRRMIYKSSFPEFRFRDIYISGANKQQQVYIRREFKQSGDGYYTYEDLKRGYFRLLADNMIKEIIPHALYDEESKYFDLHLEVKLKDSFSVRLGGNISTSNANQIYLGMNYQNLNYQSKELLLDGQLGRVYNNVQLMAKIDFPTKVPTSYRFIASLSTFDYFKKDQLFSKRNNPAFNKKDERFIKLKAAVPFMVNKRAEFGIGLGRLEDYYFQKNIIDFSKDSFDKSVYNLFSGSISFNGSTLNAREFSTQGYSEALTAQIFTGKEKYYGENNKLKYTNRDFTWLQLSYMKEQYHQLKEHWILGWYLKALYATKNFSNNYTATMMQACEFSPTSFSKYNYNEAFRANQYFALGLRPIYKIDQFFHLRGEFYGFMPITPIEKNSYNKAIYGKSFSKIEFMGEFSLVCQLPFGAISAYVNHYSSPSNEWNVGLSIGWRLFNNRFIE